MKAKINNETITRLIKEEAAKLKAELSASKEEKRLKVISERKSEIEGLVQEIYSDEESIDELFGFGEPKNPEAVQAKYQKIASSYDKKYWINKENFRKQKVAPHGPDHELAFMKWAVKNPMELYYDYDPNTMTVKSKGTLKTDGGVA